MKNNLLFSTFSLSLLLFLIFSGYFEVKVVHTLEGIGQCRKTYDPTCNEKPEAKPTPCPQGQMTWPKTGGGVPSDCEKEGFTMARDAYGNCAPKKGPCEDTGYVRDDKGNCIPTVKTQPDNNKDNNNKEDPVTKYLNDLNGIKQIWDSYYPEKGYGPIGVTFSSDGTVTVYVNKYGNIDSGTFQGSDLGLPAPSKNTDCTYNESTKTWDCK